MTQFSTRLRGHLAHAVSGLALTGALCAPFAVSVCNAWRIPAAQDSIPTFITDSDVVLEAEVLSATTGYRTMAGGCISSSMSPYALTDAKIRVLTLFVGVCPMGTTEVSLAGLGRASSIVPGGRVLLWGFHNCADGGKIWCAYAPFDDRLGAYTYKLHSDDPNSRQRTVETLTFAQKQVRALGDRGGLALRQQASADFDALAVYPVSGTDHISDSEILIHTTEPHLLLGDSLPLPLALRLPTSRTCDSGIMVGDTVVVPLKATASSPTLAPITNCFGSLRLQNGFVRYFGAHLTDLVMLARRQPGKAGLSLVPQREGANK